MSRAIEYKKKLVEIARAEASKMDGEVRIMERLEEIERIKKSFETTDELIEKLKEEAENLKG